MRHPRTIRAPGRIQPAPKARDAASPEGAASSAPHEEVSRESDYAGLGPRVTSSQREKSQERLAIKAANDSFLENPCRFSPEEVRAILYCEGRLRL